MWQGKRQSLEKDGDAFELQHIKQHLIAAGPQINPPKNVDPSTPHESGAENMIIRAEKSTIQFHSEEVNECLYAQGYFSNRIIIYSEICLVFFWYKNTTVCLLRLLHTKGNKPLIWFFISHAVRKHLMLFSPNLKIVGGCLWWNFGEGRFSLISKWGWSNHRGHMKKTKLFKQQRGSRSGR